MTTTPDSDVRAALDGATHVDGLSFDPEAVLLEGHRVVRRRRIAVTGLVSAATAVVAVVAVQLGTGQPRALPALPPEVSQTTPTAPAGPLAGSTATDGFRQGKSVDVSVVPRGDGTVRETWTMFDGAKRLGTVTRTVPAPGAGQASFLMPAESKQKEMVYGYALTGPDGPAEGHVMTQLVTAPEPAGPRQGDGGPELHGGGLPLHDVDSGRIVGSLFWEETPQPEQVVGMTWNRTNPTTAGVMWLGDGAALRTGRPSGIDAAVVTVSPRTSVLLWRDGDRFSFGQRSVPFSDPGALQVGVDPHYAGPGYENDLAVGWVAGDSVTLTSTDPGDSFTVAYGPPVGGHTPFVARSGRPDVRGTVTVTGGGESQTIAVWDSQP